MAKERGAGKLNYNWAKPEADGSSYPKISFVKYFEPFDWFIGAGIYIDEMEDRIQKYILEQIEQIRFARKEMCWFFVSMKQLLVFTLPIFKGI